MIRQSSGLRKELENLEIVGGEAGASNNEADIDMARCLQMKMDRLQLRS